MMRLVEPIIGTQPSLKVCNLDCRHPSYPHHADIYFVYTPGSNSPDFRQRRARTVLIERCHISENTRSEPRGSAQIIRVASYNIKHASLIPPVGGPPHSLKSNGALIGLERIVRIIDQIMPDIIALQEVDRFWKRSGMIDQAKQLSQELGMHACFAPNMMLDPDHNSNVHHQYGTMILSRYPIISWKNTLLPIVPGWEERGLLEAVIELSEDNRVHVANTHLQAPSWPGNADEARDQRVAQISRIRQLLTPVKNPIVLLGDFNAEPTEPELNLILESGFLIDSWTRVNESLGLTHTVEDSDQPSRRIDYVFVSPEIEVRSAATFHNNQTRDASDHIPVVAELIVPKQSEAFVSQVQESHPFSDARASSCDSSSDWRELPNSDSIAPAGR